MKKFEDKSFDVLVRVVTKTSTNKGDLEKVNHKILARDKDGINEIVINSPNAIEGIIPMSTVLQVKLCNSQKVLKDFKVESE